MNEITGVKSSGRATGRTHKRSHPLSQVGKIQLMAGNFEQIPEWIQFLLNPQSVRSSGYLLDSVCVDLL